MNVNRLQLVLRQGQVVVACLDQNFQTSQVVLVDGGLDDCIHRRSAILLARDQKARSRVESLEQEIKRKQDELDRARSSLQRAEAQCCGTSHVWEVKYEPIYTEGYTIPGDEPGTMGVDRRGSFYVPPQTTPRWVRTCLTCGKTEVTTRTEDETVKKPKF